MKRGPLMLGVMFSAVYGPAFAADTTISSNTSTPLKTSTSGNITVNQNIAVTVATTGAVVTIDSSNSVSNGGIIQNIQTGGGAIAVEIKAGNYTGSFLNDGSLAGVLNVPNAGTNNIGVLLDGNSTFNGDITIGTGSTLTVIGPASKGNLTGPTAIGVDITAPLNGNLTIGSFLDVKGEGVTGVVVTAPITGVLNISGGANLFGLSTSYTGDKVDPTSGSAFLIGASVGNGIVVDSGGAVVNRSALPTMRIAPSVAGNVSDIVLGDSGGSVNLSFANRGTIQVNENDINDASTDPGISTLGVLIGEQGAATKNVSLPGGFFNAGTILSQSRSDNIFATSATIGQTNSTALEIGNGVTLGVFSRLGNVGVNGNLTVGNVTTPIVGNTTQVVLDLSASNVNNEYVGLPLTITSGAASGETRTIIAYDGTTKLATIATTDAFNFAPQPTDHYTIAASAALVNAVVNGVTGTIKGGTGAASGGKGGIGIGLLIDPHANVPSLDNQGLIHGEATVADPSLTVPLQAYAIQDLSGTLTNIVNTGNITTTVTTLNNNSQIAVAIDLSKGTTAAQSITVTETGAVRGDVLFGSYAPTGNATSNPANYNSLIIDGSSAAIVSGSVSGVGNGAPIIYVSNDLSLEDLGGELQTQNTSAWALVVGSKGVVALALNKTTDAATPEIRTINSAGFAAGSQLTVTPTTFLPLSSTTPTAYSLIRSSTAGSLVFGDAATANSITFPAILTGNVTCDGGACASAIVQCNPTCQVVGNNYTELALTVRRKSAAELGLTGNAATIYEPLALAALTDDNEGAALMRLTQPQDVQAAINATVPDVAGGVRALTVAMTDEATGVIGARQRALVTSSAGERSEFRFWGQEFYNNVSTPATSTSPGYGGAGQGVSLGVEWGGLNTGRYGVGYTYFSSEETERHPRDTKTNGDWNMLTAYAGWRAKNLFFTPQLNVGAGSFLSHRVVSVLDSTAVSPLNPTGALYQRLASAHWDGYLASGGGTAGYVIDFGNFQVIPEVALDAMYLHEGAYNEFGAGGTSLSLDPQNQTSLRSFAGVLAQGAFRWNQGSLQPQLLAGWSHEFMTSPATIDGSFESTPGSRFHLVGPTLDSDRAIGGASVSYVFSNWQAGLNLDATRGSSNSMTEAATISLSSRF